MWCRAAVIPEYSNAIQSKVKRIKYGSLMWSSAIYSFIHFTYSLRTYLGQYCCTQLSRSSPLLSLTCFRYHVPCFIPLLFHAFRTELSNFFSTSNSSSSSPFSIFKIFLLTFQTVHVEITRHLFDICGVQATDKKVLKMEHTADQ